MGPTDVFTGNTVTFAMGFTIFVGSPQRLWFTFNIAPGAVIGDYVGVGMADATYVTVSAPDSAVCNGCPFDTYVPGVKTQIVTPTADTMTITTIDVAPGTAQQAENDVPIAALDASMDANTAVLESVTLDLTGLPPLDADVSAVRIWADNGDLAFDPISDSLLDSSVFVAGSTTLSPFRLVSAGADQRFFVTFDIDPGATIGDFVGVGILDSAYFAVTPPDTVICSTCPFDTYSPGTKTEIIAPTVDTLTVAPSDLAPAWARAGANDVPIMRLDLSVDANSATLDTMTLDLTGTGTDSDISAVGLWLDDGDGSFTGFPADTLLDAGTFALGTVTLAAGVTVMAATPETLFVTYSIAPGATVGNYVGGRVSDETYFTVLPPDSVVCSGCPLDTYSAGTKTEIVEPTLTVTPGNLAPASVEPFMLDVLMADLYLEAAYDTVDLSFVIGDLSGFPPDPLDISQVSLWLDDGNDIFTPSDTLLAFSGLMGTTFTLSLVPPVSVDPGTPQRLFLTYDIDPSATVGDWIGAYISGPGGFVTAGGETVVCVGCPFDTYVAGTQTEIVAPTVSLLTVTPEDLAPPATQQGDANVLLARLLLQVDTGVATLTSLDLDLTGTGVDADIAAADIWLDDGDRVFDPATDGPPVDSQVFVGGTASFATSVSVTAGVDETLWVSVDIDPLATVGAFIGVGIVDDTYFTVVAPDSAACGGCPFDTYIPAVQTEILAMSADVLEITLFDASPATAVQGASNVQMMRMNLSASPGPVTLRRIDVALTGTGADADIGAVAVWQDDDGDDTLSPASDIFVASSTFSAGTATLMVNLFVGVGSNETLFLVFNVSATAVVGDYVGANITATDFMVGAGDLADCPNCPLDTYVPGTKTLIVAPTGTISGSVVDQSNDPLPGATVELLSGTTVMDSTTTDANGDFDFADIAAGTYTVRATLTGYEEDSSTVNLAAGGAATVSLQLVQILGTITGVVRDEGTNEIIVGAEVTILDADGNTVMTTTTGANGRFSALDLDFGTYTVVVTASGYEEARVENVEVSLTDPTEDLGVVTLKEVAPGFNIGDYMWIIILLIVTVLILMALFFLMKRRKPAEEAPPAEEAYVEVAPPEGSRPTEEPPPPKPPE
jgi:hypothetical protein